MSEATHNLKTNQEQLDTDGVMVGVSRQALDEAMKQFDDLLLAAKKMRGVRMLDNLRQEDFRFVDAAIAAAND